MDISTHDVKQAAKTLRQSLAEDGLTISHSRALELVSRQLGFSDWNVAAAALASTPPDLGTPVPVIRVQDWDTGQSFYRDYLGFTVEWLHRFEPGLPVYARLSRDSATLDLSEHHGDGTPGTVVWLPTGDVLALRHELRQSEQYKLRPGIDKSAPGGPTMTITDPFGNSIRFCQVAE